MKPFLYFIGGCEFCYTLAELAGNRDKYLDFDYAYSFEDFGETNPSKFLVEHSGEVFEKKPDIVFLSQHDVMMGAISQIQLNQVESREKQLERLRGLVDQCELMILSLMELNVPVVMQYFPWFRTGLLNRFKHRGDFLNEEQFMRVYVSEMEKLAERYPDFYFLNLTNVCGMHGFLNTLKPKDGPWYSHLSHPAVHVAQEYCDFINYVLRRTKKIKCLMVDLDNTMWKGVIRDVGVENLQVRADVERFNWTVLAALAARGIMIGVISKNDPELEGQVRKFMKEYMYGGLDFVFFSLSWRDKYEVLAEAQRELNIGMDAIAFVDDSQFEREQMKSMLAEVSVYDENIFERLLYMPEFQPEYITAESRNRTKYYKQESSRGAAEKSGVSRDEFLKDCDFSISVKAMEAFETGRVTELIGRTNQLNTSIKRYSQSQIVSFNNNPDSEIFVVHVSDKFGDYGLVGVCIGLRRGRVYEIDTLLFSCRVMSKGVESYTLSYVLNHAKGEGFEEVVVRFTDGPKNNQMRAILGDNGFVESGVSAGKVCYRFDIMNQQIRAVDEWFSEQGCVSGI